MLPYTVGSFAPLLSIPEISHLWNERNEKRLAKFSNKYNSLWWADSCYSTNKCGEYLTRFLRDSHLPIEIKRYLAAMLGLENPNNLNAPLVEVEEPRPSTEEEMAEEIRNWIGRPEGSLKEVIDNLKKTC